MKFFIVALSLVALATAGEKEFAAEFKAMLKEVGTNCATKVGATTADLDAMLERHEVPTKHEAMCLVECMHKHWGIQNGEGKIDIAGALKSIEPLKDIDADMHSKATQVFELCAKQVTDDADPCVTAVNVMKCGKDEGAKIGLDESFEV